MEILYLNSLSFFDTERQHRGPTGPFSSAITSWVEPVQSPQKIKKETTDTRKH